MKVDLSKPVQTRDGRPARIVSEKGIGAFPVLAVIVGHDGSEHIGRFTQAGNVMLAPGQSVDDLVNVPQTYPRTMYVNLGLAHDTFKGAKDASTYDWEVLKVDLRLKGGIQSGGVHAVTNVEVAHA